MSNVVRVGFVAATLVVGGFGVALAQTTSPTGGVTSGPGAPTPGPATLGTGGTAPASPHQTHSLQNHGGRAVRAERSGQHGGTRSAVRPGASDAGAGVHNSHTQQQQ